MFRKGRKDRLVRPEAAAPSALSPARSADATAPSPASIPRPSPRAEERPKLPRLTLRFAIYTAVGLGFATVTIIALVRSHATSQAEQSVRSHARFVAEAALGDALRPSDFRAPVRGPRREALDRLFADRVLLDGALRAVLYAPDGTVTYANDHSLIGRRTSDRAQVREALGGTSVLSAVGELESRQGRDGNRKVLKAYVPVRSERSTAVGAFVLYKDYAPIARAARHAFVAIAVVLELVLLALYISLFPILRRVTETLRRQLDEIEHQALHDNLTGLPNRMLFRDRVEHGLAWARRSGKAVAVMLIDLDGFKEINDTLGHQSGDVLLQELSLRLHAVLRDADTFARLGGDEFGVVLPQDEAVSVEAVVDRIHTALEEPFVLDGFSLRVEASIGVALFPKDGQDVDTLIKRADVAMYVAKASRSGYELYEAGRDSNDARRLSLASGLRAALARDELLLHFQPKFALASGEVESVEALVRWQHPERGLLPPGEFVPIAEQTGLIKTMTTRIVDGALRECRAWADAGIDVRVAVNLDMRNLLDVRFPDEVSELLGNWNLPPERLEFEITERTLMADPARVQEVTTRLSDLGVQVSIDDFGAGYSSLAYLHRLPVDEIKIDQSFVLNMRTEKSGRAIVRSIVDLGRNLGLRVVAEGVETREALDELDRYGGLFGQGFYLASPVPAEELLARLRPSGNGISLERSANGARTSPRPSSSAAYVPASK